MSVKISILMPSLNVGEYIRQSIESVVNQTLKDIEIICIDAGSTDGTLEVLQEYAKKDLRVKLILSDRKSYGYQMNRGLGVASGEYIGIVETDDFVDRECYETLYQVALKKNAEIVKANYYEFSGDKGNQLFDNNKDIETDRIITPADYPLIFSRPKSIWSAIYNKSFLNSNGIRFLETPGASYQDTGFAYKAFICAKRVVFLKEAYLHYRIDNADSSVKSGSKVFAICKEYEEIDCFLKNHPDQEIKYKNIIEASKTRDYLWNLWRISDEFREEYLCTISSELNREAIIRSNTGILSENQKRWALEIIDNPKKFYQKRRNSVYKAFEVMKTNGVKSLLNMLAEKAKK